MKTKSTGYRIFSSAVIIILALLFTFPLYWIYPILEAAGGAVRGMGYSILSMFVIIFSLCGTRIALLAFISHTWHTIPALASVYPITWGIAMILFLISFFVIVQRKIAEPR